MHGLDRGRRVVNGAHRAKTTNVVNLAFDAATLINQVSTLISFPPVVVATNILLAILRAVQALSSESEGWCGLARRCAEYLYLIQDTQRNRIAVPDNIRRYIADFESTLRRIQESISHNTQASRVRRYLRGTDIARTIQQFHTDIDRAQDMLRLALQLHIACAPVAAENTTPETPEEPAISYTATELMGAAVGATAMAAATAVLLPTGIAAACVILPVRALYRMLAGPDDQPVSAQVRRKDVPLMFYNRNEPYYEFTNSAPVPVTFEERVYATADHLFQALRFYGGRTDLAERVRTEPTPRAAREKAERHRRHQRRGWDKEQFATMDCVLAHKFAQRGALAGLLLGTTGRHLVYNSSGDAFWGCGPKGGGRNELGKALMRLRDRLRER